ncbi:hypothetical protein [Psychrobacter sp. ANT_WB68]|uniref:hypothetical protein n=1 Tax=Psychrobacter sp. ANT_WB68 TaxID=2597355 RepID=UPI0011F400CB|nr:hypothetical protein [Psychrobacter sp. ANT_WB68]KAA0913582.1 hypothetical protein FQ084_09815 [Psychrobacter sp. ANT_WB68]
MSHLYLHKSLIAAAVFVYLSSGLAGCTSLPKSRGDSNPNRLSDNIALPQQLDIKAKDNLQKIAVSQQYSQDSSPAELFTYATTLSMREINFVFKGKYVIKNNCLYFVKNNNEYLSPIFYPDRAILFENEQTISLNGTKVKLGEEVVTSGIIKEQIGSYYLLKGDTVIDDPKNTACLTEPAVFMSGRVVNPLV